MTILSTAAIALLALTGCNTTEGIGEDLSSAGHAISHAAAETSEKMSGSDSQPTETHKTSQHHKASGSKSKKTSTTTKKVSGGTAGTGTTSTTTTTTSSQAVDSQK